MNSQVIVKDEPSSLDTKGSRRQTDREADLCTVGVLSTSTKQTII